MKELLTAKDFYLKRVFPTSFEIKPDEVQLWFDTDGHAKENVNIMIEFAKMHVEAALKNVWENSEEWENGFNLTIGVIDNDEDSILNSYPLENIK